MNTQKNWETILQNVFDKAKNDSEYAARKINVEWFISFIKSTVIPAEVINQQKNAAGCTIIERIQIITRRHNIFEVTDDQLKDIGILIRDAYFKKPSNLFLRTTQIFEPRKGMLRVNLYPFQFVPVIDAIILEYFGINKIKNSEEFTISDNKNIVA
jgi:hypothetical protein